MTTDNSLALRSLDDVERLARIATSSGLVAHRRPEAAAVVLLTGRELGLAPMASLRGIYEVSGRPVLAADLMVAVVRRSGLCESWRVVESTAARCEIHTRRKGEAETESCVWTVEDARRAGCGGQTWTRFPRQMLAHRCAAELARRVYPDVLLGLYTPDELGAEEPGESSERPQPVAADVRVVEHPAPAAAVDPERAAIEAETTPAEHATLTAWRRAVEGAPSLLLDDAARLWREHRTTLAGLLSAEERAQAWELLCAALADRSKLPGAKVLLKRRIAELDAPPKEPPPSDGAPTKKRTRKAPADAQGDAAQTSASDGTTASARPDWAATEATIRAHVAGYAHAAAVRAGARKWGQMLGPVYLRACVERLIALTGADSDGATLTDDSARTIVERAAQQRRAA